MDDDRGGTGTPGALQALAVVPDDRPRRLVQPRLRRPATRSLAISSLSLPSLVVGALGGSTSDPAYRLAAVLAVAGGALACVWLVRLQWYLARTRRLSKVAPDLGMWVMWALPVVGWVLPAVRLSRLDRATHGRRSWTVFAWAALWVPVTMPGLWAPQAGRELPEGVRAWLLVVTAGAAFGLWTAVVLRLTRGAEVVAHESGLDA